MDTTAPAPLTTAAARAARPRPTAADKCRRIAAALTEATGTEWTFGYLGNLDSNGNDDRAFYYFASHPGRVGTYADRLGGVVVEDLDVLVTIGSGALYMARRLAA